jgi:3-deoxy-D-manno-octulosonic-acid transferase
MARSIGLALYNLRPRRDPPPPRAERPARPAGRLVWLHAPDGDSAARLLALARRLIEEDGHTVLLTCPVALPVRPGPLVQPPPAETPAEVRSFLDHWRPDLAVMADGEIRPALVDATAARGVPLVLVDGREPRLVHGRDGWYPGLLRGTLGVFAAIAVLDEGAARAFRRAGAPASRVRVLGRMERESIVLPCLEAERAAFARLLAARPVWFAAAVPEGEEGAVIEAHRRALRLAHRLLLILAPADPERVPALAARLEAEEGWGVARRAEDEEPTAEVEVFLGDTGEMGLWYRLAPISWIGGSLAGPGAQRDPMEAAALGSAIVHGPRPGPYGAALGRLGAARAARAVSSAADLGEAVADLLAPDRTARLAQAAWGVATDGTEVTDRVLALVRGHLEGAA